MYTDIRYEAVEGIATVTISRPEVLNAVRPLTVEELIEAFHEAWADRSVGVVILTGAGDQAFCVGGDATARADDGGYKSAPGQRPARSDLGIDMEDLHTVIRDIPKPVIAAVNGYAIGGGHVLHVICDLTIAAEHARFGQVGPKVGSVDPGFGTAYLTRLVGEKRAREIWYLCRRYSAAEALQMGLVNAVVPGAQLRDEAPVLGRRAAGAQPHRPQAGQGQLQRRQRAHPGHRRPGHDRAGHVLRHRGVGRGRPRLQGEAPPRLLQVPAVTPLG